MREELIAVAIAISLLASVYGVARFGEYRNQGKDAKYAAAIRRRGLPFIAVGLVVFFAIAFLSKKYL
jgi:uncharacterized membrane protein YidH (DUF202 family)